MSNESISDSADARLSCSIGPAMSNGTLGEMYVRCHEHSGVFARFRCRDDRLPLLFAMPPFTARLVLSDSHDANAYANQYETKRKQNGPACHVRMPWQLSFLRVRHFAVELVLVGKWAATPFRASFVAPVGLCFIRLFRLLLSYCRRIDLCPLARPERAPKCVKVRQKAAKALSAAPALPGLAGLNGLHCYGPLAQTALARNSPWRMGGGAAGTRAFSPSSTEYGVIHSLLPRRPVSAPSRSVFAQSVPVPCFNPTLDVVAPAPSPLNAARPFVPKRGGRSFSVYIWHHLFWGLFFLLAFFAFRMMM